MFGYLVVVMLRRRLLAYCFVSDLMIKSRCGTFKWNRGVGTLGGIVEVGVLLYGMESWCED